MRETSTIKQYPAKLGRKQPEVNIAIRSDVILGSPSARCNGVGICRVMGIGEHPESPCARFQAELSLTEKGQIKFTFSRSAFNAGQLQKHFQWGLFQVLEPYRVSARLCRKLGWKSGWIYPGTYRVWETASTLTVVFETTVANLQA